MSQIWTSLGFASGLVPCQSCCTLPSRAVLIFFPHVVVSVQKGLSVSAQLIEGADTKNLWSTLVHVLLHAAGQVSSFLWVPVFVVGDWTSPCVLLCHCGFTGFGSERRSRQGPREEVAVHIITGVGCREQPGPGATL